MAKRAAEIKTKREAMRLLRNMTSESSKPSDRLTNSPYQHNDFLKAIIEQQKLVQQQELEHKQKLQQEQQVNLTQKPVEFDKKKKMINCFQEQERKRQELAYLKQLELKKRQEEKLLLIEQRKAEKNAEREKKIVNLFKIHQKYNYFIHVLARKIYRNRTCKRNKKNC